MYSNGALCMLIILKMIISKTKFLKIFKSGGAIAVNLTTFSMLSMTLSYIHVKKHHIDTWDGIYYAYS